ncbi:MAG TPA: HAD family hydrolase [Capillimicrobium sp.]
MSDGLPGIDPAALRILLCDADDCLFASERLAFVASTEVTNAFLAEVLGSQQRFEPSALHAWAVGRNFRATANALAQEHGAEVDPAELDRWVAEERRQVSAMLAAELQPDPAVREPVEALGLRWALAAVSSSALARLDVCFEASGLADLFPPEARYSAEDSLPVPTSKPDPAVYRHAGEQLGVSGAEALAVEDSLAGVRAAVAAGFPVVGNLLFVPDGARDAHAAALLEAGAAAVVGSWAELADRLGVAARPPAASA